MEIEVSKPCFEVFHLIMIVSLTHGSKPNESRKFLNTVLLLDYCL